MKVNLIIVAFLTYVVSVTSVDAANEHFLVRRGCYCGYLKPTPYCLNSDGNWPTDSADFSQEILVVCLRQRQQIPPRATRTTRIMVDVGISGGKMQFARSSPKVEPMARECA
jgi:hypothetical protein